MRKQGRVRRSPSRSADAFDDPLNFLILHLFLPPNLPHPSGQNVWHNKELLKSVYDALTRFRECLDLTQSPMVDRCARMVRRMMKNPDAFGKQVVELEENGTVPPGERVS